MTEQSTILLEKEVIELLKQSRNYPRQTYNEILKKMISIYMNLKEKNQYKEFLHKVQQEKMKELWGNEENEDWENT